MIRTYLISAALTATIVIVIVAYRMGGEHARDKINAASDRARIEALTGSNERDANVEALDDDSLRDSLMRRLRGVAGD